MEKLFNGMSAAKLEGVRWIKASRSDGLNECVEVAKAGENVAVRNSRDPEGPALILTRGEWAAFEDGMLKGEFRAVTA
ncbi:DUF397 domain-containing protein [Streptomyces sp. NPDC048106]|uniref:DUF397 domain-containing protein n=1 Tax=Streptomyces sp. NPDC048106 TaxID=3155750 RepID=UPI003456F531